MRSGAGQPLKLTHGFSSEDADRLRAMFDHAPSFMAVVRGPGHVFEYANRAFLRLIRGRDVIGRRVREALPEIEGQGLFSLLDQVYRSGEPHSGHSVKLRFRAASGKPLRERYIDFVYQPLRDETGAVTGIFADGYDVTERTLASERLKESEERFRLIADSAPVPMWVTKLDRKRSFVNRAYVDFLGITYEEAVDFDWRTVLHPDDHDRVVAESVAGEASLAAFSLEARYRRCDGEWRWLRSTSQPRLGPNGEHVGFIGVAHDITDAKEAEAVLRGLNETLEQKVAERTADVSQALERLTAEIAERERAEEALRQMQKMEAVGQLTGGIAHDFNNLLTPVIGGLELIARRMDDPRLKRVAETALESSRRGAKLTGQLLAFSRLQRIRMTSVPVNRVIQAMHTIFKHALGPQVTISTLLDEDVHHAVCDENQLENALLNLAINARDAMPDGGTLTVATDLVHETGATDLNEGAYVRVSIADSGHGMPADVLARATEPFFSTKPVGKGTGLGLAQVYGIARQSGGTVRIESEVGRGTTVSLYLPRVEPSERPASAGLCTARGADPCRGRRCGRARLPRRYAVGPRPCSRGA
jgi:PAS domain S-box-containing protein